MPTRDRTGEAPMSLDHLPSPVRAGVEAGRDLLLGRAFRRFLTDGDGDATLGRHLGSPTTEPGYFLDVDPGYRVTLDHAEADAVADAIARRPQAGENPGDGDAVILPPLTVGEVTIIRRAVVHLLEHGDPETLDVNDLVDARDVAALAARALAA